MPWRWIPPGLLLAGFAALALSSLAGSSITTDEVAHLPAGYTYIQTGDFRLNRGHPPLMKALAAVPLVGLDLRPVWELPAWASGDEWAFGAQFLTENRVPLREILWRARLPMVGVGLLLGAALFGWARRLWGYWPAVFVLFLFACCPNLLGHTGLVTTDVGVACFTLLALDGLWRFAENGSLVDAAWSGLALGLALLSKYSGLVTAAVVALLFALVMVTRKELWSWTRIALAALLIVGIPLLMIEVGFGFPRGLLNYVDGLRAAGSLGRDRTAFLWGEYSDGFWYYFLLAQWWKTPLPALICFAAALVVADWRTPVQRLRWAFLLLPIVAFHLAGMLYPYKVGIRYMLPALPFMFLACGAVAARVGGAGRGARLAFAALCIWTAVGTVRAWPHFLSYFNELAGGTANGAHYLGDSNIEWGQDLYRLRDYLDAQPPAPVRLAVVGKIGPEYYGIEHRPIGLRDLVWPEPGVTYIVGAHYLQRPSFYPGNDLVRFHWLDRYSPVDHIGGSLFVYRFSTDPAAAGRADVAYVERDRWYDEAAASLRAIVAGSPDFTEARELLRRIDAERTASRR